MSAYLISQVEVLDPEAWEHAEAFAFRAAAVKRRMIFSAGIDEPGSS
jgi:hypothetical protein